MAAAPHQSVHPAVGQNVEFFVAGGDFGTRASSFIVLNQKDRVSDNFTEIGRTEVSRANENPQYSKRFSQTYLFEEEQVLRFDVFDEGKEGSPDLASHNLVGSVTTTIGDIVHAPSMTFSGGVFHNGRVITGRGAARNNAMKLTIHCELASSVNDDVTIQLAGTNLKKMDMFGKSDPFYEIFRVREDGTEILVQKSVTISKTLDPEWPAFQTTTGQLCNGDFERLMIIRVWDEDRGNQRELIGFVSLTLREMCEGRGGSLRRDNGKDKTYGELVVRQCQVNKNYTFLDYLTGGCDIGCMVAIDFTNSNKKSSKPESLHYINGFYEQGIPTPYQHALRTIGSILAPYDADQLFPVWGFGAKFQREDENAQQAFNINFQPDPNIYTLAGVEHAYLNALRSWIDPATGKKTKYLYFSNPTHFGPILYQANEIAAYAHAERNNKQQYFVLLILTDGMVDDLQATKDQIVRAANQNLPLSIVIVGVGNADFSAMRELDADSVPLVDSNGVRAARDIVQFVPLNQFGNSHFSELSKVTLAEIPTQFMSYMTAAGLEPGPGRPPQPVPEIPQYTPAPQPVMAAPAPTPPVNVPEPPLPAGWEKGFDENGVAYYVDHNTRTSHWVHPAFQDQSQTQAQEPQAQPAQSGAAVADPAKTAAPTDNPFDLFLDK